ncbi:AMP-binding protein [Hyphomonas johnsonii]|uniref:Medium-chain-fatty-acid-CoA ligase n=1 Tax=Hyphomonas johnsonii MHS-2 TaxID=1280950 RepID=A0A059FUL9_9PROT|nr:AMP-binding protein [Hyphomonas johnsonii]KCZ94128.1 medium-chain-fatty-acid-CoA ligase [Hyphomonas johnsonii MHS-2]
MIDGAIQDYALTLDKFLDHAAKWHPKTEVVTARPDGSTTRIGYAGLRERAKRVTAVLRDLDVKRGNRIATLCWNSQAHMECWYAVMGLGAVCHTLNPRLTSEQLAWMLGQSEASILIVSSDLQSLAARIADQAPGVTTVLVIDLTEDDVLDVAGLPCAQALEEITPNDCDDILWGDFPETTPCGLCFTSGTTGAPKGVTYTHRGNYLHTLRQLQADVSGITSRDVVLPVVPMFHANAWGLPFSAPATGAKLVLPGRHSDGESLAHLIADEGVTIAVGVPTIWTGLMDYLDASDLRLPSLKRIMVGGAPMHPALMTRIEDRGICVQTTWGMTELSPLGTAASPNDDRSPDTAGRPAVGLDLMVTDHAGQPLEPQRGQEGHLWVRGSSVVSRYFGQTDDATKDGWFGTGDLAVLSEAGQVFITGRSKDLIKSGGEWINPAEIETLVSRMPEVALAAVVGRAHSKWGERPVLMVEMREGCHLSDEALLEGLNGRIPNWWMPDEVIRIGSMPLAGTGKIDKMSLRDLCSTMA